MQVGNLIQTDQLRLHQNELQLAIEEFGLIFRSDQKLTRILQEQATHAERFSANDLVQAVLLDGLSAAVLGAKARFGPPICFAFGFLAQYVVLLWRNLGEAGRTKLRGKLHQGAEDARHLGSLMFELLVGFSYIQRKCSVEFLDFEEKEEKRPDYFIAKPFAQYFAEVKTLEYDSRMPFSRDWMQSQLANMAVRLAKCDRIPTLFHLELNYIGLRQPEFGHLDDAVAQVITQLEGGAIKGRTNSFEFELQSRSRSDDFFHGRTTNGNVNHMMFVAVGGGQNEGSIGLSSYEIWKISDALADTLEKIATGKQLKLSKGSRNIVWLQVLGSTASKHDPMGAFGGILERARNELERKLRRLYEKTSFVAAHIVGDIHCTQQGEIVQLLFPCCILRGGDLAEFNVYQFGMLNELPAESWA